MGDNNTLFEKRNYVFLGIGIALMALGFVLMSGGKSQDPQVFNPEIYNFRRIRLAPTLVLAGLGVLVYAVLTKPRA
jgi:hypothetical protein